jgi:hypothetical protein
MPGTLKLAPHGRATILLIRTCSVSPGSAPATKIGPVSVIGPRPGQSVRSFFNSSIVRPGHSAPCECDMVSTTTVSPESMTSRGSSALSNQPHCVVSNVAGRMCTRPGYFDAGTTISFCASGSACWAIAAMPAPVMMAASAATSITTALGRIIDIPWDPVSGLFIPHHGKAVWNVGKRYKSNAAIRSFCWRAQHSRLPLATDAVAPRAGTVA